MKIIKMAAEDDKTTSKNELKIKLCCLGYTKTLDKL